MGIESNTDKDASCERDWERRGMRSLAREQYYETFTFLRKRRKERNGEKAKIERHQAQMNEPDFIDRRVTIHDLWSH